MKPATPIGNLHPLVIPPQSDYFIERFVKGFNGNSYKASIEDFTARFVERFNKPFKASPLRSNHNKAHRDLFSNLLNNVLSEHFIDHFVEHIQRHSWLLTQPLSWGCKWERLGGMSRLHAIRARLYDSGRDQEQEI